MKKRIVSLLLIVSLVGSLMPMSANAASESSIKKKLDAYVAFLESYGTPHWNAEIRSSNSTKLLMDAVDRGDWSYGLTSSACHGSNANGSNTHWRQSTVNGEHGCDSNIFGGAAQCFGFAKYLCYLLYGSYPTVNILSSKYSSNTYSDGFTYYKKDVAYPGLQVGDMIRYENTGAGTHAAIIYSIGTDGTMTVVDCNTKSDPCVVRKHVMYLTHGKLTEATFKKYYEAGRAYICRYNGATTPVTDSVAAATMGVDADLSASNATLRAYVSSRGEKLTECGMYIGTSSSISSMTKLGSDSINTYGTACFYKTSKYGYRLEAGKTYYYAAYAKTASKMVYGEVKSFTVPGNEANTKTYYVTKAGNNNYLAINSVPKAGNQIGRVPSGAAVKVYPDKTSGNWLYIEYNGVKGYVYSKYLTTSMPAERIGTVTGTNGKYLAINTLPSATGKGGSVQVGRIPPGAQITVYPELSVGNWYWVEYKGIFGFAYAAYIRIS